MDRDTRACEQHWSEPEPLLMPRASPPPLPRSPTVVDDGRNLYIVGNDLPFGDQPVQTGKTLVAWRVGYGSIGAPAPDLMFISPKATIDTMGRLHLLWAEPSVRGRSVPAHQWLVLSTSSIWTASYEPKSGWSSPTRIHSGSINWNRFTSGDITTGSDGEKLTAIPNEDGGVLVLALRNERWTVARLPGDRRPAYVSILSVGKKRLLAVVTADTTQPHDRNSVFLYSQEQEQPWLLSRQMQRSGMQPAMEIRLLDAAGGRLHLVWRQMIREDYFVIRHMQSDDGGASFSAPSDLLPGGIIHDVQAAAETCGRLHVVYEDWSEGSFDAVRIGHATWDGAWSRPQRLHPSYVAGNLSLVRRTSGAITLAFLGKKERASNDSGLEMMYSELR